MAKKLITSKHGARPYHRGLVFGTFDQLHIGHQNYIARAFELADEVIIMVMSDEASRPTKIYTPHAYQIRCQQIIDFADSKGWDRSRYSLAIWQQRPELYTRMLTKPLVDLVITGHEYLDRTFEMFQARHELGLDQFTILVQPRYHADGKEVTSTSIRLHLDKLS